MDGVVEIVTDRLHDVLAGVSVHDDCWILQEIPDGGLHVNKSWLFALPELSVAVAVIVTEPPGATLPDVDESDKEKPTGHEPLIHRFPVEK